MTDQVETDAAKAAGEAEAVAMEVAESESATEQKGGEVDSKVAETTEKDGEGGEASASIGEVEGEGAPEQGEAEAKESKEETVDQPTMLEGSSFATVKLAIVEAINEERKKKDLKELTLDVDSGSLADDYAVEMLMGETLSHIDGQGLLPFERYCFASGSTFPHHVEECLCQASPEEGATFEMSSDAVKEQALGLLGREIMGGGETGVARNKVLGASHTHAAVGLAINATSFRMVILVVDQYVEVTACNGIKAAHGRGQGSELRARTVHLDMKMLDDETTWGPFACVVSYRALPASGEGNEAAQALAYEDDSGEQVAVYGPWNFSVDEEKKSFGIDIGLETVKAGLYYFKVKVCPNASALPKAEADFEEPNESAVATGLVLRYDYEREITEENEEEIVAELADRDAVAAEVAADGGEETEGGERIISTEEEEAERARQEEEERLEREARRREEYERKKAEQKKYQQLLADAKDDQQHLEEENLRLQKMIATFLASNKKQEGSSASGKQQLEDSAAQKSPAELERQYRELFKSVNDLKVDLLKTQEYYDDIATDLGDRVDDKQERAAAIRGKFVEFKHELAAAAENSRTRRKIPKKVIRTFEGAESKKDEELRKARLIYIRLKAQLKKAERHLREKEQLADGLHLIDFEQLKIENQTLNEKIEERNEELHKLRKKKTTTVQVLTHIKEKLQFVEGQAETLKQELGKLDRDLTSKRDALTGAKRDLNALNQKNDRLKAEQGFANNVALVQDFQERTKKVKTMRERLRSLQNERAQLRKAMGK